MDKGDYTHPDIKRSVYSNNKTRGLILRRNVHNHVVELHEGRDLHVVTVNGNEIHQSMNLGNVVDPSINVAIRAIIRTLDLVG